jgi:hypothetical protein
MWGCVGAVARSGGWLRPEPIPASDLERSDTPFRYDQWVRTALKPSGEHDARSEDRDNVPAPCSSRVTGLLQEASGQHASHGFDDHSLP